MLPFIFLHKSVTAVYDMTTPLLIATLVFLRVFHCLPAPVPPVHPSCCTLLEYVFLSHFVFLGEVK